MRRILHLALHDSRLFLAARENFFFMFIMPVLFMLFFSVVLRGGGPGDFRISLQVVDGDGGFLGEAFIAQLETGKFDVRRLTPAQADTTDYIRRLVIPEGFGADVLARRKTELAFTKKSDSSVEYDAAAEVRLRQVQASFLGALILWNRAAPDSAALAAGTVPEPTEQEKAALLALIAEPPTVTVEQSFAGQGRPVPSGAGQSVPGMLAMFVVMIVAIGGSETLTREKLSGTLARLATTTFSRGEIIAGKLLHLGLVGFVQALVLMAAGQAIGAIGLFGIDFTWGPRFWVILVLLIPYCYSVAGLTLLLGGLFRTTQQAESLAWLVGMIFAAMGGCWWPAEIMPTAARILGGFFPTYWAMDALHGVVTFGRGLEAIALPSVILVLYGVIFSWLGSRTMKVKG
ncbi:MAG: ABC transporter permease [Candidatus Krumholzibacteriia bacterium]